MREGDYIIAVNAVYGDAKKLRSEMLRAKLQLITVRRRMKVNHGSEPRQSVRISVMAVKGVLAVARASKEQMAFLHSWMNLVFEEANTRSQVKTSLFVSTDLKLVELAIDGSSSILMKIANNFAQKCSVPGKMFFEIDNVLRELQRCHEASLWCKFKDIGGERPVVDAGIHLHSEISWRLADVLIPRWMMRIRCVSTRSFNDSYPVATGVPSSPLIPRRC